MCVVAQTQNGTWTVAFTLASTPPVGTAVLTVSASLTDGESPTVAVNGVSDGISGDMPFGTDSTLNRQAVSVPIIRVTSASSCYCMCLVRVLLSPNLAAVLPPVF